MWAGSDDLEGGLIPSTAASSDFNSSLVGLSISPYRKARRAICGATHRGLGSAALSAGFPSLLGVPAGDGSRDGGGGGGTVGRATIFRCV